MEKIIKQIKENIYDWLIFYRLLTFLIAGQLRVVYIVSVIFYLAFFLAWLRLSYTFATILFLSGFISTLKKTPCLSVLKARFSFKFLSLQNFFSWRRLSSSHWLDFLGTSWSNGSQSWMVQFNSILLSLKILRHKPMPY